VHFIACHKGVTEAQAIRQLGYPDVTVVTPPFGVYVADEVQKIQMLFLKDCRDATSTRSRVDEAREWLDRAQEAPELRRRAKNALGSYAPSLRCSEGHHPRRCKPPLWRTPSPHSILRAKRPLARNDRSLRFRAMTGMGPGERCSD